MAEYRLGFSCRFRVAVAPWCSLASDALTLPLLETSDGQRLELSGDEGKPLAKSRRLALSGHGWPTKEAAEAAGKALEDVLLLSLVRTRVGVESWPRRASGGYFEAHLRMLEAAGGPRTLNDFLGLTVYQTEPVPRFAGFEMEAVRGGSVTMFVDSFTMLEKQQPALTDRERVAVDLFNASFFEPAADTRVITLVMAVEALLDPELRPAGSVALVQDFIGQVKRSSLPGPEQDSLLSALGRLQRESIKSAGRRLARERLGQREYRGQPAAGFFDGCYDLRSDLVHGGDIRKARVAAASLVEQLERFVSDLITSRFVGPTSREGEAHG